MLVTEAPQFKIQDCDSNLGTGIPPTSQWHLALTGSDSQYLALDDIEIDPTLSNVLIRLRYIFHFERISSLTNTDIHDLTCYVLHKLLSPDSPKQSDISECFRYSITIYMLSIHGTTYYSHDEFANNIILRLRSHLEPLLLTKYLHNSAGVWIITVGLAATVGTLHRKWFISQACAIAVALGLQAWEDVLVRLDTVFWTRYQQEELVQHKWEQIFTVLAD